MRAPLIVVLGLLVVSGALAQASGAPEAPGETDQTPKPYTTEEFSPWMLELRRFEIIAVGAFPVAYLLVGMTYDYAFYVGSGFPSANLPWPVGPGTSGWTGEDLQRKNWTLVAATAAVSLAVAGADWLLGRRW